MNDLSQKTDAEITSLFADTLERQGIEQDIMLKSQREQWLGLCATHKAEITPIADQMRKRRLYLNQRVSDERKCTGRT